MTSAPHRYAIEHLQPFLQYAEPARIPLPSTAVVSGLFTAWKGCRIGRNTCHSLTYFDLPCSTY